MVNPYFIIGAMIAVGSAYGYGHHVGWGDRDAEMQLEIAKKNEEAREKETQLAQQLNEQSSKLSEANNVINQKQSSLDRAIRDGRLRLQTTSCVQAPASTTVAAPDTTDASESDRQTLAAIAAIVAEGDAAILQLNACIASYNEMRELVNGKR